MCVKIAKDEEWYYAAFQDGAEEVLHVHENLGGGFVTRIIFGRIQN